MKIELNEHYQSMSVKLAPGIYEVNGELGAYLVTNGYAIELVKVSEVVPSSVSGLPDHPLPEPEPTPEPEPKTKRK